MSEQQIHKPCHWRLLSRACTLLSLATMLSGKWDQLMYTLEHPKLKVLIPTSFPPFLSNSSLRLLCLPYRSTFNRYTQRWTHHQELLMSCTHQIFRETETQAHRKARRVQAISLTATYLFKIPQRPKKKIYTICFVCDPDLAGQVVLGL